MPPARVTLCGYELADVRKNLRDAIDRRDARIANRWTAELVATPGAIGSLWASYWVAWASAQGAGSPSLTIPILLHQTWEKIVPIAHECGINWSQFRNDTRVRAICGEMTKRLLTQPRPTPVVWPSKEIIIYDVNTMRSGPLPAAADSSIVLRVWDRDEDAMELRFMAGRWIDALQRGDIRSALSAIAWTMMTPQQQGLQVTPKCRGRGPVDLPPKQQKSPIWFWLAIGKSLLASRKDTLHRGWSTFHDYITEAFRIHTKRWTATDRMRLLLAWTLHIRASMIPQPESIWTAPPIQQTHQEIEIPYQEIAAELADPNNVVMPVEQRNKPPPLTEKEEKKLAEMKSQERMREADAKIMAMLGLTDDD